MNVEIIKKRIKNNGLTYTFFYYACKVFSEIGEFVVCMLPKKTRSVKNNRIVFKNRQGQDYTDNARALFDYMIENNYNETYEIIWLVSNTARFKKNKYKNVKYITAENKYGFSSLRAYYYGNTAKYFFYTNNTADLNRCNCSEQIVINLWHGCGYKGTTHGNSCIKYSRSMEKFDYALVPGPLYVKAKAEYWECSEGKILPIGYPRYDWLLDSKVEKEYIIQKIYPKRKIGLKLVVWLPTFRKTDTINTFAESNIEFKYGIPLFENNQQINELNEFCRKLNILLVIKKHPIQIAYDTKKENSNIIFLDDKALEKRDVLLYHMLNVSDALITDYSSVAVDYMLLNRPIGFVVCDYHMYAKTRGFIFENPLDYMPGEKIYDISDLNFFLRHVSGGVDLYEKDRLKLMPVMHNKCDNYSKRILDFLKM